MTPLISDIGAYFTAQHAAYKIDIVAGSSTDNVEVTTAVVDRLGYGSGSLIISFNATLASTETISFTVKEQESADNSTWDTAATIQSATVAATGTSGVKTGVVKLDLDYTSKKRYIKYLITADLSASATDTADWHAISIIGGADELPI